MTELTGKYKRTIDILLNRLINQKSFSFLEGPKDFAVDNALVKHLRLANKQVILLTDTGLAHFRNIVANIDKSDVFEGIAGYPDIWGALHGILEDLCSKEMRPDDAAELVELIRERLNTEIDRYTFAVPLSGIKMDGIDEVTLGSMKLVRSPVSEIETIGVKLGQKDLTRVMEATQHYLWLLGSAYGTSEIAERKFHERAQLVIGILAILAASIYNRGASPFRISIVMSPQEVYGPAVWLIWTDKERSLMTHQTIGSFQQFKIDDELVKEHISGSILTRAFEIIESENRTELEEAVTSAIRWFSDAHRDTVPVMQLVKYWSCIETFFSGDGKDITKSVSTGLANVLVYGGFGFVPKKEYVSFKRSIAKFYNLRSRALHGAAYYHVSQYDIDKLSQWVAWLLMNMVSFVQRGYTKIGQVKEIAERLDAKVIAGLKER